MVTPSRIRPATWDKVKSFVEEEADTWHFLTDNKTDKSLVVGFVIGVLDRIKGNADVAKALANDLYEGVGHGA